MGILYTCVQYCGSTKDQSSLLPTKSKKKKKHASLFDQPSPSNAKAFASPIRPPRRQATYDEGGYVYDNEAFDDTEDYFDMEPTVRRDR